MDEAYVYDALDRSTFTALACNAVGRASEIGTFPAYSLTHSTGNSGWSIGIMQTDLSSSADHAASVAALLRGYQAWAPADSQFDPSQITSLSRRLNRGGQTGNALTDDEQSRLNTYLRVDAGRAFVATLDQKQIDRQWSVIGQPLSQIPWLQRLNESAPAEAAQIVGMNVKLFNQNENHGRALLRQLQSTEATPEQVVQWIGDEGVRGLNGDARAAIVSGRDNALAGVALMNSLELGSGRLSRAWRAEVHQNDDAALAAGFNDNPNLQLLDGMMRDSASGARIFANVESGQASRPTTIKGFNQSARLEMSRIDQDKGGGVVVVSPTGDQYVMTSDGWNKNGLPLTMAQVSGAHSAGIASLDEPAHPGYPLFREALAGVRLLDASLNREPDVYSMQLAGSLAVSARAHGLGRIDQVVLSDGGTRAFAIQGDLRLPFRQVASVDTALAVHTSIQQSSLQWWATSPPSPGPSFARDLTSSQESRQEPATPAPGR